MSQPLSARFAAEMFGTALLVAMIIGSAYATQEARIDTLLINAIATGGALYVAIALTQHVSGGHLNPVVTVAFVANGDLDWHDGVIYILAQCIGGLIAVIVMNTIFSNPYLVHSTIDRVSGALWLSELIMTFGLVLIVLTAAAQVAEKIPALVATYVTIAIVSSSSGAFINPAVTLARIFTNANVGIAIESATPFIISQFIGGILATIMLIKILCPLTSSSKKGAKG